MDTKNSKLVLDLLMNIPTITTTNLSTVDQWFSPGTLVSSINKIDRHDTTEILFKGVKHPNPNPYPICAAVFVEKILANQNTLLDPTWIFKSLRIQT